MIYTFGDSFTDFYPNRETLNWTKLLSDKLGVELINRGLVGCSNSFILKTLINELENINKNDYIIVQISGPGRMDVPISENEYRTVYASDMGVYNDEIKKNKDYVWDINQWKTIEDYFINFHSLGFTYRNDIELITKITHFIYKNLTKNVILWNICSIGGETLSEYNDNIDRAYSIKEYTGNIWLDNPKIGWIERIDQSDKSIYKQTNKQIKDYHLSEEGHIWLSEIIFKKIKNDFNNCI
jgi:hypothetical protein